MQQIGLSSPENGISGPESRARATHDIYHAGLSGPLHKASVEWRQLDVASVVHGAIDLEDHCTVLWARVDQFVAGEARPLLLPALASVVGDCKFGGSQRCGQPALRGAVEGEEAVASDALLGAGRLECLPVVFLWCSALPFALQRLYPRGVARKDGSPLTPPHN